MALTQAQLDALNGKTDFTPKQSAAALGHSTGILTNLISTGGAIAGGIGGAALGGLAGIETGPGALATSYLGGVAGSGAGAAAGEALGEKIETGSVDARNVLETGGITAGLEAVGGPVISAGGKLLEATGRPILSMGGKIASKLGELMGGKVGTQVVEKTGLKESIQKGIVTKALTPKLSSGEMITAGKKGQGVTPTFGAPKIDITKYPNFSKMFEAVKGIVKGKSAIKDTNAVRAALSREAESLQSNLEKLDHGTNIGDLNTTVERLSKKLDSVEQPISLKGTPFEKQVQPLKDALLQMVKKNGNAPSRLLQSRKEFDSLVEKTWPNLYESESAPMKTAVTKMRSTLNDFIEESLPKGSGYKDSLELQKSYYDAIDNISTKIPDEIRKGQTFAGRNPKTAATGKLLKTGALMGIGFEGEQQAQKFLGL